jgi:hypothetical protein
MADFLIKLVLSVALTLIIKGGFALFDASIPWLIAAIAALVIVFGVWFIIVDADGWD